MWQNILSSFLFYVYWQNFPQNKKVKQVSKIWFLVPQHNASTTPTSFNSNNKKMQQWMSSLQRKIEEPTKGVQIKERSTQQSTHKSSMVSIIHLPNLEQIALFMHHILSNYWKWSFLAYGAFLISLNIYPKWPYHNQINNFKSFAHALMLAIKNGVISLDPHNPQC